MREAALPQVFGGEASNSGVIRCARADVLRRTMPTTSHDRHPGASGSASPAAGSVMRPMMPSPFHARQPLWTSRLVLRGLEIRAPRPELADVFRDAEENSFLIRGGTARSRAAALRAHGATLAPPQRQRRCPRPVPARPTRFRHVLQRVCPPRRRLYEPKCPRHRSGRGPVLVEIYAITSRKYQEKYHGAYPIRPAAT
jgi:hypothetical protein